LHLIGSWIGCEILGANRKQNTPLNGSSVVFCISVVTGMYVHWTALQQRSIPCCHENACLPQQPCLSKPLP
jgi:hypothetical protein